MERDFSKYDFSWDQLRLRDNYSECVEELQPWIIENAENSSFEIENDNKNLVVNLEDLVNEEYFINRISEHIHKKKPIAELWKRWWKITDRSSVKEMAVFFEEPLSKKLIKNHQMLLWIFIGFLQITSLEAYNHLKIWTNTKNIINYLHRNFLVFVQFICNNLTEEQFDAAYDWAIQLENVLKTRSVMKSHYNVYNSDLLQNNNSISFQLLKDLLRQKTEENNYRDEAYYILKNIDGMEIQIVRDFIYSTVNNSLIRESSEKVEKRQRKTKVKNNKEINPKLFNFELQSYDANQQSSFRALKYNRAFKDESMQDTYIDENPYFRRSQNIQQAPRENKDVSTSPLKSVSIHDPPYEIEYEYKEPESYNHYYDKKNTKDKQASITSSNQPKSSNFTNPDF